MTDISHSSADEACNSCGLRTGRRDFLAHLASTAAGALIASGVPAALAAQMRPVFIRALGDTAGDPTYPIPAADGVQIDTDNQVILVRWQGFVYGFNLSCPHQRAALRWHESDARFECPKHHSKYQPDGTYISGRATRDMDRFSLTRDGNTVVVHVNAMHKSDADPSGWRAATIPVAAA